MIRWGRLFKHLLTPALLARQRYPEPVLARIAAAIHASEALHAGEICFAVEAALDLGPLWRNLSARERALEVFSLLRVWDTEHNSGVLIYLLLADHDIEVVADRSVAAKVAPVHWEQVCQTLEAGLRRGEYETAVIQGVQAVGALLQTHFPPRPGAGHPGAGHPGAGHPGAGHPAADTGNELPDHPTVL